MSVHSDSEPRRFGLVTLRPAFLVQPGLSLRAIPRFCALLLNMSPLPLGARNASCRIDAPLYRRLEFCARWLLRIRKFAAMRVDEPEGFELTTGAILDLGLVFTRTRASRASGRSMCICIDRESLRFLVLTGSGELWFVFSDRAVRVFPRRKDELRFAFSCPNR